MSLPGHGLRTVPSLFNSFGPLCTFNKCTLWGSALGVVRVKILWKEWKRKCPSTASKWNWIEVVRKEAKSTAGEPPPSIHHTPTATTNHAAGRRTEAPPSLLKPLSFSWDELTWFHCPHFPLSPQQTNRHLSARFPSTFPGCPTVFNTNNIHCGWNRSSKTILTPGSPGATRLLFAKILFKSLTVHAPNVRPAACLSSAGAPLCCRCVVDLRLLCCKCESSPKQASVGPIYGRQCNHRLLSVKTSGVFFHVLDIFIFFLYFIHFHGLYLWFRATEAALNILAVFKQCNCPWNHCSFQFNLESLGAFTWIWK